MHLVDFYIYGYISAFILEIISISIALWTLFGETKKAERDNGIHFESIKIKSPGISYYFSFIVFRLLVNPLFSWIMVCIRCFGLLVLFGLYKERKR